MSRRRRKQSFLPLILVAAGSLFIVGAIIMILVNSSGNDPVQQTSGNTPAVNRIPFPDIPRVSIADARAASEMETAVIVDVRGEPYYSDGHIAGALNIAEDELPGQLLDLPRDTWIITYCT